MISSLYIRIGVFATPIRTTAAAFGIIEPILVIVCLFLNWRLEISRDHILGVYLLITNILNIIRTRSLWNFTLQAVSSRTSINILAGFQTASLISRFCLFGVQLLGYSQNLSSPHAGKESEKIATEEKSNFLSVLLFWWVGVIMFLGYRREISSTDLEKIAVHSIIFVSTHSRDNRWLSYLYRHLLSKESPKPGLRLATQFPVSYMRTYLTASALRLVLVAVTFAQPFIISGLLSFLQGEADASVGVWLVLAVSLW